MPEHATHARTGAQGTPRAGSEKRQTARQHVNHEFGSMAEFISEYVSDVSSSGVFIRTDDPLPVGTPVDLRFTVIVDDLETIEGMGEVVRVVPLGQAERAGMGVRFTELTPASRAVVGRIVARA